EHSADLDHRPPASPARGVRPDTVPLGRRESQLGLVGLGLVGVIGLIAHRADGLERTPHPPPAQSTPLSQSERVPVHLKIEFLLLAPGAVWQSGKEVEAVRSCASASMIATRGIARGPP